MILLAIGLLIAGTFVCIGASTVEEPFFAVLGLVLAVLGAYILG